MSAGVNKTKRVGTPFPKSGAAVSTPLETPRWDHSADLLADFSGESSNSGYSPQPNNTAVAQTIRPKPSTSCPSSDPQQLPSVSRILSYDESDDMIVEGAASAEAPEDLATISRCRLAEFWTEKPALWFHKVEADFAVCRIRADDTKFNLVIRALDDTALEEVADIICSLPVADKYDTLKARILQRLAASDEKKLEQMLTRVQLGDKKPSQLYRQMSELAGENATEPYYEFLRHFQRKNHSKIP